MGECILHGNGGGGVGTILNLKIVGGTTEPTSPSENMIWVNTDAEITSWVFSATEPESPGSGMVWISTGTYSQAEFNALKKNSIVVYPLSAKQYISSAWVDVTAQSYIDGAWANWILYLYQEGNTCDSLTGGYTLYNATLTADHIYMDVPGADQARICTNNPIDLTNITTLYLEVYDFNADDDDLYMYLIVTTNKTAGVTDTTGDIVREQYRAPGTLSNSLLTMTLDVSQVTGEYYVKAGSNSKAIGTSGDFKVREIKGDV